MTYRELFEAGKLGIVVSKNTDGEKLIKSYGEDPDEPAWKSILLWEGSYPLIFCIEDRKPRICYEDYKNLVGTLTYEDFLKIATEEVDYKKIFKQGRIGVKVTNKKDAEEFIELFGEDSRDPAWEYPLSEADHSPIIFCIDGGQLAVTGKYDEELVEIVDYKKFIGRKNNNESTKMIKSVPGELINRLEKLEQEIASIRKELIEIITVEEDEEDNCIDNEDVFVTWNGLCSYKKLFKQGKLGVRVSDPKECEDFITLCKEDPHKDGWQEVIEDSEWVSVIFCIYEYELATTTESDEELITIISYDEFMKEEGGK